MIYNVNLNSKNRASGTVSNATYFFDWSVLPDCSYKVSFNFVSSSINTSVLSTISVLEIGLGQSMVYKASSTQTRATSTNNIGFVLAKETSTNTFLYGDNSTIPFIYLNTKPSSNEFKVRLLTNGINPIEWTDSVGSSVAEYVLIISLDSDV
jgi:hypothetical protein